MTLQRKRFLFQAGFFLLFVLAPVLDIFRFDLNLKHFIFFRHAWTLGLDPLLAGEIGPGQAALNIVLRGFVPLALLVGGFIWVSWKYGRLYCGWMCPHFSVVETINRFLQRTIGKHSLWDRERLPEKRPDGQVIHPDTVYWWLLVPMVAGFALLWALSLLTYLLPPAEIYFNVMNLSPTRNQALFLSIATGLFFIDFMFARHLFCISVAPWASPRAWCGWPTRRPWWWAMTAPAPWPAPIAMRPATTPVRCGSSRVPSNA